jgi:hypothetical protein
MSNPRGSESLPAKTPSNPFAAVPELEAAFPSPFTAAPAQNSPFRTAEESIPAQGKIPARKGPNFPFEVPEAQPGFGFEAAPSPFAIAPIEAAAQPAPVAETPAPQPVQPVFVPAPPVFAPAPQQPQQQPAAVPVQQFPAQQQQAPQRSMPVANSLPSFGVDQNSDSFTIRQLELRAIFGVDREMNVDELMQRSRTLPGVRHVARVRSEDISAIDGVKSVIANLGFGGNVKLHVDSGALEFIRESGVLLAVQTDAGFLPGIRETLIIVARELSRSA